MIDLFKATGVDAPELRRKGVPRAQRVPLFNPKVVYREGGKVVRPDDEMQARATKYAKMAASENFAKQNETAIRNNFYEEILCGLLGYRKFDSEQNFTLAFERAVRGGSVDAALGSFSPDGNDRIVAPFEMKGPDTVDLDAIMPGRKKSPVQQAWDYAIDSPGSKWVLVSNCVKVRLYGFGKGRDAYEEFDLRKLDSPDELARLHLLLAAENLLGTRTDNLLRESETAAKDITDKLYAEYKALRDKLIQFLVDSADGPRLKAADALEPAQKILDRILFIAFAQRTDLLPDKLLELARDEKNKLRPGTIWENFLALFRSVDVGNEGLGIWAYNGGLFATDSIVDSNLAIPDPLATELANLVQWDYRSEVPVTILGRIFEQSITDLEKLRAEARGEEPPKVAKKKKEGVVYTPDIVTRFLVEQTVAKTLDEKFDELLLKWGKSTAPLAPGDKLFLDTEAREEAAFWREYSEVLRGLRIVDPACGSGAFLVAAFDHLAAEYRRVVNRLVELGEEPGFDSYDEIVTKNLYGVDLNPESVEITRLALWLKTARRDHRLQNLERTIKAGNSLISDPQWSDRPFNWREAFPEVFEKGGFDVVIGNPPYVRMEYLKPVKPYLAEKFVVAADRADLYAYFFECGVGILRAGGRLGYISSSTFFRTGSGENLRKFLSDHISIETVIDFGDLQLFEGVTTYPAILTLRKGEAEEGGTLSFLKIVDELPKDLDADFTARATPMPRARLGSGSWQFEDDRLARLRAKIVKGKKTLGEVYGAPLYGIKTGLNEAFIIDRATRDRLVKQHKNSAKLLKPFLRGENVKCWRVEPEDLFLINTPKGKVKIDDYPAIRDWLLPFKKELEKRATKQEWWELQQAQLAYQPSFTTPKIIYGHFAQDRIFAFDAEGYFSNDKSYFIPNATFDLLSLLNSKISWSFISSISPAVRGGFHEMRVQYLEKIPIPKIVSSDRKRLAKLGEDCTSAAARRLDIQSNVRHRILDLASPERAKLSRKLEEWWMLDFSAFRDEVKRAFRAEVPVKERGAWEAYLAGHAAKVHALNAEIEKAEREIDTIVYRLFDLTPDEVRLLEESIEGEH